MRLNKAQQINAARLIQKTCGCLPPVFENGVFEFFCLNEDFKDKLMESLSTAAFVSDICARKTETTGRYKITGTLLENFVDEDIELHDTLNPKIWTKDNELLPEVEEKINAIVNTFIDQITDDDIKITVDDIYLVGSNANYNYTDVSDLDIHLITDQSFDCDSKHLPIIYNGYKALFNKNYDITINGVNVELYVENKDDLSNASAGVYSLKKGWISKPARYDIPEIDEAELEKQIQEYEKEYLDITDNPSVELVDNFIDKLYDLRINSIQKDGEFGIGNLVFKEFRHLGYLDELKELKTQLISKELSL